MADNPPTNAASARHTASVAGVDEHRAALEQALGELGLDWSAWPGLVLDDRLSAAARVSAVLVLLATDLGDEWDGSSGGRIVDPNDASVDNSGRARSPWRELARTPLEWDAATATTALRIVAGRDLYDERRLSIALRAASKVCRDGHATVSLLDALRACIARLEWEQWQGFRADIKELQLLARRVLASATPPDLLDLSLVATGDTWGGPARGSGEPAGRRRRQPGPPPLGPRPTQTAEEVAR